MAVRCGSWRVRRTLDDLAENAGGGHCCGIAAVFAEAEWEAMQVVGKAEVGSSDVDGMDKWRWGSNRQVAGITTSDVSKIEGNRKFGPLIRFYMVTA